MPPLLQHFNQFASRLLEQLDQSSNTITQPDPNPNNNNLQTQQQDDQASQDTFVYIVLGILIVGFLFFVGNTIRCYLTRPRDADFQDEEMMDNEIGSTDLNSSPNQENISKSLRQK